MTADKEKILDKLRKLQAMADAAGTTEAEAQAFAAKVQELLTAYKLSAQDIGSPGQAPDEPINSTLVTWQTLGLKERSVRVPWAERMAMFISHAYYCEFIISGSMRYDKSIGYFIGTETDRQVAVYMFVTMARFLDKLADEEMHKFWVANNVNGKLPEEMKGFKGGFMHGFIMRLKERFDDEIRGPETAKTMAIVHVRKGSIQKANEWFQMNVGKTHQTRGTRLNFGNPFGRAAGKRAADGVDLHAKGLDAPTTPEARRLR